MATVFDKLNQVYKDYLEAEQSYTAVSGGAAILAQSEICEGIPHMGHFLLFVGHGVRSKSRQRRPEAPSQDAGGHRPIRHVHTRPVIVHGEEGRHSNDCTKGRLV